MQQTYPIQTAPSPLPTTFILASQLGLALNCDLLTGLDKTTGLPAADDGPAINAAMAGATAHNPLCLVMDGSSCVSGLMLPAGGHWSIQGYGHDTGFFAAAGTNNHVIHNGTSSAGTTGHGLAAPVRSGGNVSIRDLFINGNQGDGIHGNSNTGSFRGNETTGWYFNICLDNLNEVLIENVWSYASPSFQLVFENCGNWVVNGCRFDTVHGSDNSDGIHVFGPSNDGRISNCYFHCGDDPIALNACEGYSGLITRIAVTNCVSYNSMSMMRIYSASGQSTVPYGAPATLSAPGAVDGVTVTNYVGSSNAQGLIIGNAYVSAATADSITNVTFTNCKFTSPLFAEISDTVGTITFDSCEWIGGTDTCMFVGYDSTVGVSMLKIANCQAIRTPLGSGIQALLGTHPLGSDTNAGSVRWNRVIVNGFSVVDIGGYTGAPIAGLLSVTGGGTLGHLQIDAIDASNIAGLIVAGTVSPTTVAGGGLLQTGWQISDAIVANSTPYFSSDASGAPSIKVSGVAKRLTLA